MSHQRQWRVTLAACWPNGTWTEELVDLDESDFPHLDENGPSDGEIAEAALNQPKEGPA